jgi:hypothetical protein
MKKPHLVILEKVSSIPVKGGCSSCKETVFSTGSAISSLQQHQTMLEQSFREHFRTVHEREDGSQAAARIVREATENHWIGGDLGVANFLEQRPCPYFLTVSGTVTVLMSLNLGSQEVGKDFSLKPSHRRLNALIRNSAVVWNFRNLPKYHPNVEPVVAICTLLE